MSRTDVHRPWRVQITDPYNRPILYRYAQWYDEMAVTSFRNIGCGCRLCTGHYERELDNRRTRAAWRAARQQALALVDRDDVDVPTSRRRAYPKLGRIVSY